MSSSKMPSSFDDYSEFREEGRWEKFTRKIKEEPLIPFGCALTCYALYRASRSIRAGDHDQTNRMFRARIYAQFFTILCIVGGSYYYAEERQKRKVFDNAIAEKKTVEKREAWIRELEARDKEEKELRAQQEAKYMTKLKTPVKSVLEESERRKIGVLEAVRGLGPFSR